jgi:hypothetical protein
MVTPDVGRMLAIAPDGVTYGPSQMYRKPYDDAKRTHCPYCPIPITFSDSGDISGLADTDDIPILIRPGMIMSGNARSASLLNATRGQPRLAMSTIGRWYHKLNG